MKKFIDVVWMITIVGLGFAGQWIIRQNATRLISFPFTTQLNSFLRLGGNVNTDNFILGVLIWIFCSIVLYRAQRNVREEGKKLEKVYRVSDRNEQHKRKIYRLILFFVPVLLVTVIFFIGSIIYFKKVGQTFIHAPSIFFLALMILVLSFWLLDLRVNKHIARFNVADGALIVIFSLITILLLGYNLRFPREMVADEAAPWETVRAILRNEYTGDLFSYGYYTYPVMNAFIQAGIIRTLHLENAGIVGWRFTAIPIAVLIIIGTYLICLKLFHRRMAIFSSLILIVNPFFMVFSRISFPTNQSIVPPLYTLLFIVLAVSHRSFLWSCLAGISSGFGFYVYSPGKIAVVIGVMYVIFLLVSQKNRLRNLQLLSIYLFSFLLTALPIFYESKINAVNATWSVYNASIFNIDAVKFTYPEFPLEHLEDYVPLFRPHLEFTYYLHPIVLKIATRNLLVTITSFFHDGLFSYVPFDSSLSGSEWEFFAFVGMLLVIINVLKKNHRDAYLALFIWFLLCVTAFGVIWGVAQFWRMEPVLPVIAIFSALTFDRITVVLREYLSRRKVLFIMSVVLLIFFVRSYHQYFTTIYRPPADEDRYIWELANAVNDAKKNELVFYVFDEEEGIKTAAGSLFDSMHLYDSRYKPVSNQDLEGRLAQISGLNKVTFIYEKKIRGATETLENFFSEKGQWKSMYSDRTGRILFYRYDVLLQ